MREDWLSRYLKLTDKTEPIELVRLWGGISTIAAVLQRKVTIPFAGFTIHPNLFVLIVAQPGMRKTQSLKLPKDMLYELGINIGADKTTLEALITSLSKCQQQEYGKDDMIEFHSSLSIFSDEFAVFLKQRHNNIFAELCAWFDCPRTWKYETRGGGDLIINCIWFNLIGCTTPETVLREMISEGGGGLMSRFICVYADKINKNARVVIPDELKEKLIDELAEIGQIRGEYKLTDEALDFYEDWYMNTDMGAGFNNTPHLLGYAERRALHLTKLSCISSASRNNSMIIDLYDFQRSMAILEATEKEMLRLFNKKGTGKHRDNLRKVVLMIKEGGDNGVLKSQVLSALNEDITSWDLESIIKTLTEAKLIRVVLDMGSADSRYINMVIPSDSSAPLIVPDSD